MHVSHIAFLVSELLLHSCARRTLSSEKQHQDATNKRDSVHTCTAQRVPYMHAYMCM